jgi:5-methylcytosine-specific restriction endonuclease McrA
VTTSSLPRTHRGTSNSNARGSSRDRAARRAWLLATFGDGVTCPCYRCGCELTDDTLTVDRRVPGARGGTYRRSNIRPACSTCNSETGATTRRLVLVTLDPDDPDQMERLHQALHAVGGPTQPEHLSAALLAYAAATA